MKAFAVACGAISVAALPCWAAPHDWKLLPEVPHSQDDMSHPRRQLPVAGLRIGRNKIDFEHTRWTDVQRSFGRLKMRRQGDAGGTEDWTCFTATSGGARYQAWLHGGELQGGELIDGVTAQQGSPWPLSECPLVSARGAALANGIWVGTTEPELVGRLGHPSGIRGSTLIYDFEVPVHDLSLGRGAIDGRLIFEMRGGRVHRLFATMGTSF